MNNKEPFSERYGYKNKGILIYEDAPESVRVGIREILANLGLRSPIDQRDLICRALRKRPDPGNWSEYNIDNEVDNLIHDIEWYEFYDMCEKITALKPEIEDSFNVLFQEEYIGYKMTDGYIEKVGSKEFDEAIIEVLEVLKPDKFTAPLEQFKKALRFRNNLPPDYANAVKESVISLEGVLQVSFGKLGTPLPSILTDLKTDIPKKFIKIFKELYGYGTATEGGRHSSVGGYVPSSEEAEFIIHCSAASIRYVILLHPDSI